MMQEEIINALNSMIQDNFKIVDLSYVMEESMPCWPTHARFGRVLFESYKYGDVACHHQITMSEHTGTHIDAPLHFFENGSGIDKVPLDILLGRAILIDATNLSPQKLYSLDMLKNWEKENFSIKEKDIVMFHFGWDKLYSLRPNDIEYLEDWPGLSEEAAKYLVSKKVSTVGTDALALDAFNANNEAHRVLLSNEVYILENLRNLDKITTLSFVIMMPLKIKDGSGSPLRVIALVPTKSNN